MKIPFWLTVNGLILKGKEREIAKIRHEIKNDGFTQETMILNVEFDSPLLQQLNTYKLKKLEIEKKYNKIDEYEYEYESSNILNADKSEEDLKCLQLIIKQKYGKIDNMEFHKQFNDIKRKPFVALKSNYDETADPDNMEIEVVYNRTFVEQLSKRGLPASSEEELIDQWLKLYFMANLEQEDLALIGEEDYDDGSKQTFVSTSKVDNGSSIIG